MLVLMSGFDLPLVAIREQIASAVDLIVQQQRCADGQRRLVSISEVTGSSRESCKPRRSLRGVLIEASFNPPA